MSVYIVVFEWPATARAPAQTRRIEAPAPEAARLRAAELFSA